MTELKPCPFCGDTDALSIFNEFFEFVSCEKCSYALPYKAWNNRPAEAKIKADAVRDAQAEIMEGLTSKVVNSYEWDEYINKLEQGE